ncbi:MAG: KamA family radical SAM protein, partial [Verrucomicrobiia bacterium]
LRASVCKGLEIMKQLRGHTTGYAVPQYVIDAPGGGGKVPMNPQYITKIDDDAIHFRNFEGKLFRYPLKSFKVDDDCRCEEAEIEVLIE